MSKALEVRRAALHTTRLVNDEPPAPAAGEVLLRVLRFGLTANNITYGTMGDSLGYWRVFPAAAPEWGRLPMWGFAEVVASSHPDVADGRQLFGYVPMSSHLVIAPTRVNTRGLTDFAEHRRSLAPRTTPTAGSTPTRSMTRTTATSCCYSCRCSRCRSSSTRSWPTTGSSARAR